MPPSAAEARALYRAFLRVGSKFTNYNVREYVKRRAGEGFRESRSISDPAALEALWATAREELEVARRQATVFQLYHRKQPSVMDLPELQAQPQA